jgi:hypothetical protein
MSSAPTGFSISYHKRMSKGNDDLRIQAALGRLQQQSKQGTSNGGGGTSQLLVCQFLSIKIFIFCFLVLAYLVLFIHHCVVEFSNHFLAEIQYDKKRKEKKRSFFFACLLICLAN